MPTRNTTINGIDKRITYDNGGDVKPRLPQGKTNLEGILSVSNAEDRLFYLQQLGKFHGQKALEGKSIKQLDEMLQELLSRNLI
ncbi:MAG: hypothetical protein ACKVI2_03815 [Candidatus Pelagibacterales bacterium]|jgi:hypothetical protein|tara:strand:+ start:409 stop:660 length:252 start_codon:yes stop_codon:yes gene_type:complete